jgi:DNA polymerase-1
MNLLLIDSQTVLGTIYSTMSDAGSVSPDDYFKNCVSSIKKSIKSNQPSHVLFCMDDYSRSWRREVMPGYRQDRFKLPLSIEAFLPKLIRMLKADGIASLSISNHESYDIISTLTKKIMLAKSDATVTILGTDTRLYPLVSKNVELTFPYSRYPSDIKRDLSWVLKRSGIKPSQWTDYIALTGCDRKSIAGIPGVGPKTAEKLLMEYGSVQAIGEERAVIDGQLGNNVRDYIDYILNVTLPVCKLNDNLSLGINLKDMLYSRLA